MKATPADRVGLTWHPRLAASVLSHADRIDIVEVIPEGVFLESRKARRALRTLARSIPVAIHGVSLGLSSAEPVDSRRLDAFARLVEEVAPEHWSEHLAFVRAGGIELGHLAAPSRTALTLEATAENIARARRRVGCDPLVENVATLIEPPGNDRSEAAWLCGVLATTASDLLLDLHNLVTNGRNFGFDPRAVVDALPPHRIRAVHLAGGREVEASTGERRLLDDHRHAVPDEVYVLLELVGERVPHALDVILERDGAFPPFEHLLGELDRARTALASGRARRAARQDAVAVNEGNRRETGTPVAIAAGQTRACQARIEGLLARLLTDELARARFLADPVGESRLAGLEGVALDTMAVLDRPGLELAAESLARKRQARGPAAF